MTTPARRGPAFTNARSAASSLEDACVSVRPARRESASRMTEIIDSVAPGHRYRGASGTVSLRLAETVARESQ